MIFGQKKSKTASIMHNLCLIIHNYVWKRRHFAYSAAPYYNKSSLEISA